MKARLLLLLTVLVAAPPATAAAGAPLRPESGGNFYLFAGASWLHLDLEPADRAGWEATGLAPASDRWGVRFGVGWAYRAPVRLELFVAAHPLHVARPGFDAVDTQAGVRLAVAVLEGRRASLQVVGGIAATGLGYTGPDDHDEVAIGGEALLGALATVRLGGPWHLDLDYHWLARNYEDFDVELPDEDPYTLEATADAHQLGLRLVFDL